MKNFNLSGRHSLIPNFLILIFLFLLCQAILLGSCKKTEPGPLPGQEKQELLSLTVEEATQFLKNSIATAKHNPADSTSHFLTKLNPDYTKIYHRKNSGTDSWNLVLKGFPKYLGQKLGYRKLRIFRDSTTRRISAESQPKSSKFCQIPLPCNSERSKTSKALPERSTVMTLATTSRAVPFYHKEKPSAKSVRDLLRHKA